MKKYFGDYVVRFWDNVDHASFCDAPTEASPPNTTPQG